MGPPSALELAPFRLAIMTFAFGNLVDFAFLCRLGAGDCGGGEVSGGDCIGECDGERVDGTIFDALALATCGLSVVFVDVNETSFKPRGEGRDAFLGDEWRGGSGNIGGDGGRRFGLVCNCG